MNGAGSPRPPAASTAGCDGVAPTPSDAPPSPAGHEPEPEESVAGEEDPGSGLEQFTDLMHDPSFEGGADAGAQNRDAPKRPSSGAGEPGADDAASPQPASRRS